MKLIKQNIPFTMVANEILSRTDLSWKAKGLYAYLFSKPDSWDFSADRIAKDGKEERKTVLLILKELEDAELLKRRRLPTGRVQYDILYSESHSTKSGLRVVKPKYGNDTVAKRHGGKLVPISNTEGESKKDKENNIADQGSAEIPLVIDLFKEVNPTYRKFFANKTQRAACMRLVEIHGFEKISKVVAILPKTNKMPFIPNIVTPLQLEDGWAKLENALTKKKAEMVGAGQAKKGSIL